jgi:hypothetical protein
VAVWWTGGGEPRASSSKLGEEIYFATLCNYWLTLWGAAVLLDGFGQQKGFRIVGLKSQFVACKQALE